MQQSCSHYSAFCTITLQICMYQRAWQQSMPTIMQPSYSGLQPEIQQAHTTTHTAWTSTRCRTHKRIQEGTHSGLERSQQQPPHTHTRYLSSPPAAALDTTTQGSGFLPNPSPVQHSCSHCNACWPITWRTPICRLRTCQQNMATIMQPARCDLQPGIQQAHTAMHAWTTARCRTPRENRFAFGTIAAATAAHTRYLSSPRATTLDRTTQGIMLWLPPRPKSHATFMPPLRCVLLQHVVTSFNHRPLRHHPSSSPFVFTSLSHHVVITLRHHFPQPPPPSSSPFVLTSLSHHPSSPSSSSPFVITLRHHCPPSSPFVITHHFPPSPPSFPTVCDILLFDVNKIIRIKVIVTRKIASQPPLITSHMYMCKNGFHFSQLLKFGHVYPTSQYFSVPEHPLLNNPNVESAPKLLSVILSPNLSPFFFVYG